MRYVITHAEFPSSCLPEGLDRSRLVEITAIGDAWRKYLDPATGEIHDGAKYAQDARKEMLRECDE